MSNNFLIFMILPKQDYVNKTVNLTETLISSIIKYTKENKNEGIFQEI